MNTAAATEATFIKCECTKCHGHFEIPADYIGELRECPHCKEETLISEFMEEAPVKPQAPVKQPSITPPEIRPVAAVQAAWFAPGKFSGAGLIIGIFGALATVEGTSILLDSKTVFQQIAGYLAFIGGFVLIALAILIQVVKPICRYLFEIVHRLESIEERLADRRKT